MQSQILKLKEELDNNRQELIEFKRKTGVEIEDLRRELQQMKNSTQQGTKMNSVTAKVTSSFPVFRHILVKFRG